jgi:hypothetical protein
MNRGGGTRNPKTRDCGNLMLPCHTLSHPQVTRDWSHDDAHDLARDLKPEDMYDWLEDNRSP